MMQTQVGSNKLSRQTELHTSYSKAETAYAIDEIIAPESIAFTEINQPQLNKDTGTASMYSISAAFFSLMPLK